MNSLKLNHKKDHPPILNDFLSVLEEQKQRNPAGEEVKLNKCLHFDNQLTGCFSKRGGFLQTGSSTPDESVSVCVQEENKERLNDLHARR